MIIAIRKIRNTELRHIAACLIVCFSVLICFPKVHASDDLEAEVTTFFSSYFKTARRYDVVKMIEHLSRNALASNLRPIVRSPDEESIIRSVLLLFNAEFIFAGYCRFHIFEAEQLEDEARVRVWLERTKDRTEISPIYDFFLVWESGRLRLDRMIFVREDKLIDSAVDIELCDVPINWDNPALLKPGESAEEQQRRLGIP